MSNPFHTFSHAIDDALLEEAMTPSKKPAVAVRWLAAAAAACLLILLSVSGTEQPDTGISFTTLSSMGYNMTLPEDAESIRYAVVNADQQSLAQVSFLLKDTEYVYQAVKTQTPQPLAAPKAGSQPLAWSAESLQFQLISQADSTCVSWYIQEDQTQCYLSASAGSQQVLTTASQILQTLGLDVAVAPAGAQNITYNAFLFQELTVAETSFLLDGVTYSYRMAGTTRLMENFTDLSGLEGPFDHVAAGDICWCRAKLRFNEDGQGKIIWFDVAPGILYSLSMDSGASEQALLDMAVRLYQPAQNDS